jgi:predicted nucleotidyltransferase
MEPFMLKNNIQIPLPKVEEFCRKWRIKEFALFGSVLREDFKPSSDIDVIVSFDDKAGWDLFDLVDMMEELKVIFGRNVDLVEKGTIRNPFRRHAIMTNNEVLYAA